MAEQPKEKLHLTTRRYDNLSGWGFIAYPLGILVIFLFIPVLIALVLSFTNADINAIRDLHNIRFIGFDNFTRMFSDSLFWIGLGNTFYFLLVAGPVSIALSLGAALLLNVGFLKWRGLFQTLYFVPVVTTIVAIAIVWRMLYEPQIGLINHLLSFISLKGPRWLQDPVVAMPALIIMASWKNFGYNMVILLAGLQAIPSSYYEAAKIDGASDVECFWYITLPQLKPVLLFVIVMVTIGYLQFFAEPYVMTGGGPLNSTYAFVMHIYYQGFQYFNMGYASALSYVLFLFILILSWAQMRLMRDDR